MKQNKQFLLALGFEVVENNDLTKMKSVYDEIFDKWSNSIWTHYVENKETQVKFDLVTVATENKKIAFVNVSDKLALASIHLQGIKIFEPTSIEALRFEINILKVS